MKLKKITLVLLGMVFMSLSAQSTLPNIGVKYMDGNTVTIKSQVDSTKLTIISFWATWCGPCIKELEAINDLYSDWQDKYNVDLIAVSIDDARNSKKVKPKVLGLGWPYKVVIDENMELARAMNVVNPPMLFIVNQKGDIVYTHSGYSPGSEDELAEELKKFTDNK